MQKFKFLLVALAVALVPVLMNLQAHAVSARVLNAEADQALTVFRRDVRGGADLLARAKGVLVMPRVVKAGFGLGAEYGEGVLRVGGATVDYYRLIAGSVGWQLGAQKKTIMLLFMEPAALEKFRNSSGWKVGADASVALITVGAEGSIDTQVTNKPIVAFVIDQKGLMYDLSLEGAKFTKIKKR